MLRALYYWIEVMDISIGSKGKRPQETQHENFMQHLEKQHEYGVLPLTPHFQAPPHTHSA